ncbi:DUF732 domain-containing protein [Prescottella subtropica]|uniref:DUF732 domain-containing protein n=1 Tax=Prescottella subtropica TaxID=2545757 RepID=UPI001293862E|nr:DUF732 domain-containing protein [Prescottella subtropica]
MPSKGSSRPKESAELQAFRKLLVLALVIAGAIWGIVYVVNRDTGTSSTASVPVSRSTTTPSPTTAEESVSPTPEAATSTGSSRGGFSEMDGAFFQSLDKFGISYASPSAAISAAKTACSKVGSDPVNSLQAIVDVFQQTTGQSRTNAQDFVGLAVLAYCPQYNDYVTF